MSSAPAARPERLGPRARFASAPSTARPRPTSRSRAARSPPIRSSPGSRTSSHGRAASSTTRARAAARCFASSRATTGGWSRRGRSLLLVAFVLLFGPAALSSGWALANPEAAVGLVPAEFRPATQSERPWRDLTPGEQAAFTTAIFTNNIQVTLVAFAGGVTFGVLTGVDADLQRRPARRRSAG